MLPCIFCHNEPNLLKERVNRYSLLLSSLVKLIKRHNERTYGRISLHIRLMHIRQLCCTLRTSVDHFEARFTPRKIDATSIATGETPVARCCNGLSQESSLARLLRQLALRHATRHALRQGKHRSQAGRWLIMRVFHLLTWTCDNIV